MNYSLPARQNNLLRMSSNFRHLPKLKHVLLIPVLLFSLCQAKAQSELWGVDVQGKKLYKVDGNNPSAANYVRKPACGYYPMPLALSGNGKLYGTTQFAGSASSGTLFEYDPATDALTNKVDFVGANGSIGAGRLTLAANGKFYGTTSQGGSSNMGVLFEYDPVTNIYTKKIDFDGPAKGSGPAGNLTIANNGKFYGVTSSGGSSNFGVLFEYDHATNTCTKKVDFNGSNGYGPTAGLALAGNGKLYGTTQNGGSSSMGVLFEYDPATNTYTKRVDFTGGNGQYPQATLTLANGKLYGVTYFGGSSGWGLIFEYDYTTNTYTLKHDFIPDDAGADPQELTLAGNGKLYGVTEGGGGIGDNELGALFEYDPVANTFTKKIQFVSSNPDHPAMPSGGLLFVQTQTITGFAAIPTKTFGDAPFTISATGGASGNAVVFTSNNTSVATVSGNTITIVGTGTVTITASQAGNTTYLSAPNVAQNFTVNRANQAITFGPLADKGLGDAPFALTGSASSGLPVTYTSSNTAVATISGSTVTIVGAGTTTITASQPGNVSYNAATNVLQTLTVVTKQNQTISFGALATKTFGDAPFALTGTTSSGLPVTYTSSNTAVATVSGSTVTIVGGGTTTITASQAGSAGYNAATSVPQTLTVNPSNQTITFSVLADKTFGDASFALTGTTSSGLAVTYTSSNTAVATVSGNTLTIVGAGTTTITASHGGNANFNAAADVPQTLTVNKQNQIITFGALSTKTFGDIPLTVTTTGGTSGNAIILSSSNTAVATVSGNTITIVGAGTTTITASQAGNTNYNAAIDVPQTLTVNKASQSIIFNALGTKTMGDAPFVLSATNGGSGNAVTFTSSNTAIATIIGNVVTIVGAGTTTITASQAGNTNYNAAPDVPQSLTVNKGNQAITFGALSSKTFGDAPFTLTGTASSALAVSYVSSNTGVATVSGSTVTIVGAGSTTITASQAGNANYNVATSVPQNLTVNKAIQAITFNALPDKLTSDTPFNLTATATSGLTVSYTSSNTSVATVSGNTVTIVGVGTTTITASQAGNASYNAATSVPQNLSVSTSTVKSDQTITFNTLPDKNVGEAPFNLTATASSGLTVSYASSNTSVATISGNTVTIMGVGTTIITASQAGNVNYNAATSVSQTLTVNKANQVVTFDALSAKTYGDAPFTLTGTASSGLPVSYVSSNTSVALVSGSTLIVVGAGTTTITASQAGNANYNAATGVPQTLTINKANQVITFSPLPDKAVGDAAFNLTATASSGLPVTYLNGSSAVATLSGSTVTVVGVGTTSFLARQSGNSNYNAATPVAQGLTVKRLNQSITFNPLPAKNVGDAPFELTATASSGLPVTYISSNTSVATISGSTLTIVGRGSATIDAGQLGNDTYNPAATVALPLIVNKLSQTISFTDLLNKTAGDAPFDLTATASSGLPLTYTSNNPSVATLSGNTVTIVGAGTATITATQAGNATYDLASPASRLLNVNKLNQAIGFSALDAKTVGDIDFDLTATANSGLPVTYTSSNPSVATVSGGTVTIVGGGSTIITALQSGNASYNAAMAVTQMLTVNKSNQTITFAALADKNVGDANFNLTATASSSLAVSYTSSNTAVATVSGNTVTIVGVGTTIITASQSGNANINAAASVTQSLTVSKLNQTITFSTLADKNVGDASFNLTANASSSLSVSYSSSNASVATVLGNTVAIVGGGTTIITASQNGNANFNAAAPVTQSLTVNKSNQSITFNALVDKNVGDAVFNLTATANSGLTVSYTSSNTSVATVSGSIVTIVGAGTTIIAASQSGNLSYNAATSVLQGLTVNKSNQDISFSALTNKSVGDNAFDLIATVSSGLPVSYASSNTSVATISGNTVTIVGAGTSIITASQNGNSSYNAATPVSQTFTVNKSNQTIVFSALADKIVGDADFDLTATTTSGLPITYVSSNTSVATTSGSTVTVVGAGSTIITASQSGNTNFNVATSVTQILKVKKATQTITFDALPVKNPSDASFDLTASSSSGLVVSYLSSNTSVATIAGSTVTLVGVGTTIITALQSGNANFYVASSVSQILTVTASRQNQTITFNTLANKTVGDAAFNLVGIANSGLAVIYTSSNTSVATVAGTTVTIVGSGVTTITASQPGNANYNAAADVYQSFTVNKKDQIIAFNGLADKIVGSAPFNLAATASSGLGVTYNSASDKISINGNQVSIVKPGRATIIASQAGNAVYKDAISVSQSFCITPVKPAITIVNTNTAIPLLISSAGEGNQWFLNDVAIAGATTTTFNAIQPGVYKLQVNVDGCISEFSTDKVLIVTGTEKIVDDRSIEVYPNPTTDWLTVSFAGLPGRKEISIHELNGIEKTSQEVEGDQAIFHIADYAQAVYVVRIKIGSDVKITRFIKR